MNVESHCNATSSAARPYSPKRGSHPVRGSCGYQVSPQRMPVMPRQSQALPHGTILPWLSLAHNASEEMSVGVAFITHVFTLSTPLIAPSPDWEASPMLISEVNTTVMNSMNLGWNIKPACRRL